MTTPRQPDITTLQWRKSSYSGSGNNCVEVATMAAAVAVRDSKNPDRGHLVFETRVWRAFVAAVKVGKYS